MLIFRDVMNKMGLGGADSVYLAAQKSAMLTEKIEGSFPQVYTQYLNSLFGIVYPLKIGFSKF